MKSNPVALITGGNRGLGKAMVLAFANKKYAIGLNFKNNKQEAEKTKAEIEKSGVQCELLQADVGNSKEVDAMVKMVEAKWGRIDVLVNNAGLARDRTIQKMSNEEWGDVLNVNLNGTFYCTRASLRLMTKAKTGSIVNISSYRANRPNVGAANYAAAKAAVISLTKSTALEMGRFGVRVNAVMPGFHVTDMNRDIWEKYQDSIKKEHLLSELPNFQSLADFVVYIAHQKTVSGQVFPFESRLI